MRRALATLTAALLWLGAASAETKLFTFAYDEPPEALTATAMTVVEGETDVTITFGGDCTLGGETGGGARRFADIVTEKGNAYPFENLYPLFSADDLTLVNLEGVLSNQKLDKVKKEFNFKGKSAYTAILSQGGVEAVTLANNHAMDYGETGKADTIAALTAADIGYCDETTVMVLEKDGVRVGITASVMGLNRERFLKQVEALRNLGCAAILHVMHMGVEYADTLTDAQTATAKYLAENGVALVVGHHPHVVQGVDVIGNTTVAYSLGNCVFGGNTDPRDYDAVLLGATLRFAEGQLTGTRITLWPIRVSCEKNRNDYRPVLLSGEDAQRVMDKIQATSGIALVPFVNGQGAVQAEIDWR